MDPIQSRLSYYDKKWNYLKSISLFGKYAIGVDDERNIYCMNLRGENIISVLDQNGKIIESYGGRLYPDKPESALNTFITAVDRDGTVWVGYQATGNIFKYTKNGRLEYETNVMDYSSKFMKNALERNLENEKKGIRRVAPIITGIVPTKGGVIVTGGGIVNLMFRLDSKCRYQKAYYVPPKYRFSKVCFYATIDEKGEEIFYLKENTDGEYSIGIYGRGK